MWTCFPLANFLFATSRPQYWICTAAQAARQRSRVCHHCRAGGPVTPTLTTVPCPPGWSGSTWVHLHLGSPVHLCCSSSDNLPSSCNPTIQLFHALPTLISFSSNNYLKSLSVSSCENPQGSRIHRQFFRGSNFKRPTHRDGAKFLPKILHQPPVCGFICFKRFCSFISVFLQHIQYCEAVDS